MKNCICLLLLIFMNISCGDKSNIKYSKEFNDVAQKKEEVQAVDLEKNFAIKLDSQPGTGYFWVISEISKNIEIIDQSTISSSKSENKTGLIEKQLFVFRAKKIGSAKIELHYKRVWEKGKKPAKVYILNLNVKEPKI